MPFVSKRAKLQISAEDMDYLAETSRSRTESLSKVHRAKILLAYHQGDSISQIAREMRTNRPKVERTVQKALAHRPTISQIVMLLNETLGKPL